MKQKVFHLCSGITGVIFFLAVQGINASPSFYLGTDKIFGTHEAPYVNLEGPGYNSYNLRVYRISNPEKFIHENLRQRQVTEKTKKARGNAIALFRSTWSGYKDDFQKVARQELKGRTRVHIKNSLSVKLNAPHPQQQLAVPELLEDHQFLFSRTVSKSSKAWDYRRIPISIDREGFYLIEVIHGMDIAHTVMIKSNVQFMAKQSDNETLIFSARKDSGEPISDVAVDIFNSETGQKIHSSDSNSKGIVFYKGTTPAKSLIVVRHDSEYALSDPNFYSNSYYGKGGVKSYIYTERPVYRPGQKVFFKGIVRNFQNDRYKISSGTASFSVYAENGNVIVENQNLQISNSMGSFSGNFVLPDQDDLYRGVYNLVLLYNQKSYSTEFSVESYKKPRFLVKVNTLKNSYYSRDKIPVTVSAKYYAGNPVVQADVHYRVFRSPRYHYSVVGTIPHFEQSGDYLGQTNTSVQNQLILDKTGKLNESGEFSFVIQPDKHDQDYSYSVITSVTDPSETLGGSRAFSVNRGQFYINIRRENTVYNPGDVMKLKAELVPFDKSLKAAEKKKIVEGISVSADLVSRSFQSISEENSGEVVSEHSSVTDASGTADFSIPIQKSGHYLLRFHTEDKDGNELTADTTLWASAVSDSISIPFRNLVMKAGKDLYSVGEEAEVIIISPVADASLFLALESNRILDYEHVKLKGNI
ncbi:MAG: MG2 domain-containing protein, partial [Spirochaetia bacterium]|nr:MG2 domain-containing protein [Spirochaetia bacterium]